MQPDLIVELDVAFGLLLRVTNRLVHVEIDLFILEASPEAFHKDVIPQTAAAIHTDLNPPVFENPGEFLAGELAALIRVEDLWLTIAGERLPHRVEAEIRGERVGQPPRQHPATRPIQDRTQIHKAAPHRNVGDIGRPHVIRLGDRQLTQQIRVDPVGWMPLAGARHAIDRPDAHPPHQRRDLPSPNGVPLLPEEIPQHAGAVEWILQMQLINPPHKHQRRVGDWPRFIVGGGPSELQQLALPDDR